MAAPGWKLPRAGVFMCETHNPPRRANRVNTLVAVKYILIRERSLLCAGALTAPAPRRPEVTYLRRVEECVQKESPTPIAV